MVLESQPEWVAIGTTPTALATNPQVIEDEYLVALDVFTTIPLRDGQLSILIEAAASPTSMGSASPLPGDFGETTAAFDDDRTADAQVTELHYGIETRSGVWTVGHTMAGGKRVSGHRRDSSRLELYYRYTVFDGFEITPDIQFHTTGQSNAPDDSFTACVRFRLNF